MAVIIFGFMPSWRRIYQLLKHQVKKIYGHLIQLLDGIFRPSPTLGTGLFKLPGRQYAGSTACFFRVHPGVILKAPVTVLEDGIVRERPSVSGNFVVERRILERLGEHPLVIRYLGWQKNFPTGLLFAEASHGNLQRLLNDHNETILPDVRKRWVCQAVKSVAYVHSRGVIHSDLRPDNFLVHGTWPQLDLWLCDFGGSTCGELGLSANKLPDAGFFDPNLAWEPSPSMDIFSLGSVLFTILTGHWPFRSSCEPFSTILEMEEYESLVDDHFARGDFPSVRELWGGDIILKCWGHQFSSIAEVVTAIDSLCSP